MKMNPFKRGEPKQALDLQAPKQPGEKAYTGIQLTRLINFIIPTMNTLKRLLVGMTALIFLALGAYALSNGQTISRLEKQNAELEMLVEDFLGNRTQNLINSCNTMRYNQDKHNASIAATQRLVTTVFSLTAAQSDRDVDPTELQVFIDTLNVGTDDKPGLEYAKIHGDELRDCSAEGMAEYYNEPVKLFVEAGVE